MPDRPRTRFLLLVALLLLGPQCTRPPPDETVPTPAVEAVARRPNVVLVTLCSFRRNRLGLEGYERELTPFLDGLGERGVYFENAVASSSWTKPTTASLLTGVTPGVHQMTDYYEIHGAKVSSQSSVRVLSEHFETLPEALRSAGYRTMCRVNNPHAGRMFRMTQGCDDVSSSESQQTSEMIDAFGRWLEEGDRSRPFFFYLMTLHAHAPYKPSYESYSRFSRWEGEPVSREGLAEHEDQVFRTVWERARKQSLDVSAELEREWIDLYDATVADLDRDLGALTDVLDRAGVLDETVIVVTADHGEAFWENGMIEHGLQLSETLVAVPLIVAGPGVPAGRRVADVVRTIDVYPTLAALAGAPTPDVLQGESLAPYFESSASPAAPRSAYSSLGRRRAVRLGAHKLSVGPNGRALFDVTRDPLEERDLRSESPEVEAALERALAFWREQERSRRALVPEASTAELSSDTADRLRALGYLDSSSAPLEAPSP